jgi:hypothetical protein
MAKSAIGGDAKAALGVAGLLILVAAAVGEFAVTAPVTLLVAALLIYAMARIPVRYSMMALMLGGLTFENPAEGTGCGAWESPFRMVGGILLNNINSLHREAGWTAPFAFSGMLICFVTLLIVVYYRSVTKSKIDGPNNLRTPKQFVRLAFVSLAGTACVWIGGLARGGDFRFSLWQVNAVLYLPIIFFLFQAGLRGPQDFGPLAKVLIFAGTYRAALATYIQRGITHAYDAETGSTKLPYATSHHDSMLFAATVVLLLALVIENTWKGSKKLAIVLLPVLALGMQSNNRRMVWVQVALVMSTIYLVSPDNRFKRFARRAMVAAAPVAVIYVLAGWNSGGRLFKPVQMLRSVVDAQSDSSSFWRELENFDLIATLRNHPILGAGYGNGYEEVVVLPAIPYELERYLPHNSILGLWAFCGYFGYTAMTLLWAAGVYFGMRAYHRAKDPVQRAAGLASFSAVMIYLVQCWGDMGLGTWTGVFLVGPALAVAGKLAAASGEWGKKSAGASTQASSHDAGGVRNAEQAA